MAKLRTLLKRNVGGLLPLVYFRVNHGRNPLLWWTASIEVTWFRTGLTIELGR